VTILAISLGAPFWFDLLNKMMVIRSTVKPREKSREEGSEDRSAKTDVPSRVGPAPVGGVPAGRREPQIRTGPDNIGTLTCRTRLESEL
jgi:hypothetical protein